MNESVCDYTGLDTDECPCMMCRPSVFFFKYLVSDYHCKNISNVISALRDRLEFFKKLKEDGFRLSSPVNDRWAEFEPPDTKGFFWVQCASCECYLKFPIGTVPPAECPECGKNLYEYEIPEKEEGTEQ